MNRRQYIPALSFHRLTAYYDHIIRWVMSETIFRNTLVDRCFDGRENTRDHASGKYQDILQMCGFEKPARLRRFSTAFGTLELIETKKL